MIRMVRYNSKRTPIFSTMTPSFNSKKTVNDAGGEAFTIPDTLNLITRMLTSFDKEQYYKSSDEQHKELESLIVKSNNKEFVAKCALYARNVFGMRSITHYVAAVLAKNVKGEKWTKHFYKLVFRRVDDVTETFACYLNLYGKPFPNSLKKGARLAMNKFDGYQLAKYRAEDKAVKLVDVFNIVHPKPTDKNKEASRQLIVDELRQDETWESMLSAAGKNDQAKKKVWSNLIREDKLGYFALLRNLKNIEQQAPEVLPQALEMLKDRKKIQGSLVLPFRYLTAYERLENEGGANKILEALNDAADISLENVPTFEGRTLVVLDQSGSMTGGLGIFSSNKKGDTTAPIKIGSLFCAILAKKNNTDVIVFGTEAHYKSINTHDSVLTIASKLNVADQGGTDFKAPFGIMNKPYDRIIILSDMQGWIGYDSPYNIFKDYCTYFKVKPVVYSFDLAGYGSLQLPYEKVFCLAGFSEKVFNLMKLLETDSAALEKEVSAVEIK